MYKYNAKKGGIAFEITPEQFLAYWKKPCYYCGYKIHTIGLDRVDSTQGYTVQNIVPCCRYCNRGKNDLTKEDFLAQCHRIASRFPQQSNQPQSPTDTPAGAAQATGGGSD